MEKSEMDRISELTALARVRELTEEEQAERARLRADYIAEWRRSAKEVLDNTYIVDEKGNKRKLGRKS